MIASIRKKPADIESILIIYLPFGFQMKEVIAKPQSRLFPKLFLSSILPRSRLLTITMVTSKSRHHQLAAIHCWCKNARPIIRGVRFLEDFLKFG